MHEVNKIQLAPKALVDAQAQTIEELMEEINSYRDLVKLCERVLEFASLIEKQRERYRSIEH